MGKKEIEEVLVKIFLGFTGLLILALFLVLITFLTIEGVKMNPWLIPFLANNWPWFATTLGLVAVLTAIVFLKKYVGRTLKKGWGTMKKICKSNLGFALMLVGIYFSFYFFVLPKMPRLSAWALVKIFLAIGSFSILAAVLVAITAITLSSKKGKDKEKSGSLIRNIPSNHVWILRYAFHSDPGDETHEPKGYVAKREGWRWYLPYLLHVDMGLIDMAPKARDPEKLTKVNTSDNQTAEVDWQFETEIFDPIRFIIRARDENGRVQFEDQKIKAILSRSCSDKTQEELTRFQPGDLKAMSDKALNEFNTAISFFGIRALSLDIKKIIMPEEIRDAAEYQTVTKSRAETAKVKGQELKTIINATGASPTVTVAADIIRGGLNDLVELIGSFKKRNNKGD